MVEQMGLFEGLNMSDKNTSKEKNAGTEKSKNKATKATNVAPKKTSAKELPGDFTYTGSYGTLKKFLDIATEAARPEIVNAEYLESKGLTGGSATAIPPILKKMKFLDSGGKPTKIYAQFQTKSSRSQAALAGLKNAYSSIFDRNRFAHTLSDDKLKDIVVEISGLDRKTSTFRAITGTYKTIHNYISLEDLENSSNAEPEQKNTLSKDESEQDKRNLPNNQQIGLSYQINIILPETSDITIYNAIFKSLKENLL